MNDLHALGWILRVGLAIALVAALAGAFVPGTPGDVAAVICIGVLIAAPVLRVAWLTVDWAREGDRRFAALGSVLLAVLATSGAVALF